MAQAIIKFVKIYLLALIIKCKCKISRWFLQRLRSWQLCSFSNIFLVSVTLLEVTLDVLLLLV